MKQILFYTDTPNYGGAEKQMTLLAKHLPTYGFEVSLACGKYSAFYKKNPQYFKNIYGLPTFHKHDPRHYFALKKLLKNNQFDLIHIHLWNPGAGRYAFWAASHAGVPIITTEHDPFPLTGWKHKIKLKCLTLTDQIIAVSSHNYRQLGDYGEGVKKRLHMVNNGIDLQPFLDIKDKVSLPVPTDATAITCIAELHPRKGHQYLLKAFKKLKKEFPTLHLLLVGKGPIEKQLKQKYDQFKDIHFLGWRNDIPQILNQSDLFILPSPNEAFGLVLIEAMASGTLVIATNQGGPQDIIKHGETGYLVAPKNVEALVDTIKKILKNPEQKKQIEKNALKRAQAHFSADIMTKKTAEVYKEITDWKT